MSTVSTLAQRRPRHLCHPGVGVTLAGRDDALGRNRQDHDTRSVHPRRGDALHRLGVELAEAAATALGSPDGQRITHHKGVVLAGTFTATPRAAELSVAPHLQGDPVPVTVRFSNGFPSPEETDTTYGDPRGMAVKFHLGDGRTTDLVCQDWPVFPAATPEKFRDLLLAQHAGAEETAVFLAANPDVAAAAEVVATVGAPPGSWATLRFNSLNAFVLVAPDGSRQPVRFTLTTRGG